MSHEDKSKKRDRDDRDTATLSYVQTLFLHAQNIKTQIDAFTESYMPVVDMISRILPSQSVEASQAQIHFFGGKVPSYAKVWTRCLMLLSNQALIIDQIYDLNDAIKKLGAQLKEDNAFADERKKLALCYRTLGKYINFVGDETSALTQRFREADPIAQEAMQKKLDASSQITQWIKPFFEQKKGVDPLFEAVSTIAAAQKEKEIERIIDQLNTDFISKLDSFIEFVEKQLEKTVDFEEEHETISALSYAQKVEYFAMYCVNVLQGIRETKQTVSQMMGSVHQSVMTLHKLGASHERIGKFSSEIATLDSWGITLSIHISSVKRFLRMLVSEYDQHVDELSPALKAFMKPWLDNEHPNQLVGAIYAFQHPQYFSGHVEFYAARDNAKNLTDGQKRRLV